jgi:hypothetical protein
LWKICKEYVPSDETDIKKKNLEDKPLEVIGMNMLARQIIR